MTTPVKPKMPFEIDITEETARGQYINTFIINHTENEFLLDFAIQAPGFEKVKVLQRIIVTPKQMERFAGLVLESYKKWDSTYGNGNKKEKSEGGSKKLN